MRKVFACLSMMLYPMLVMAGHHQSGFGGVAQTFTTGPLSFASGFINAMSLMIGASFLFASIIKYVEHRRSPLMVPMSTVVFLLIAGVILVAIPILTSDYVYQLLH